MPKLRNPKHEKFAEGLAEGMTIKAAFVAAGYKETVNVSQAAGSIKSRYPEIMERAEELKAIKGIFDAATPETPDDITEEWVMMRQVKIVEKAISAQNFTAANAGISALMKAKGMFNKSDKVEIKISLEDKLKQLTDVTNALNKLPAPEVVEAEFEDVSE